MTIHPLLLLTLCAVLAGLALLFVPRLAERMRTNSRARGRALPLAIGAILLLVLAAWVPSLGRAVDLEIAVSYGLTLLVVALPIGMASLLARQ